MSYQATVYNVMISAPGDVDAECQAAREVIHAWNAAHAEHENKVLLPLDWKRNTVPDASRPAQESINKQIVEKTDLLVAIFKHRLGTPTDKAPSGSVEEIQEVITAGKPVLLYFSQEPIPQERTGLQWESLQVFKKKCEKERYFHTFLDASNFNNIFKDHIARKVHDFPTQSFQAAEQTARVVNTTEGAMISFPGTPFFAPLPQKNNRQLIIQDSSARKILEALAANPEQGLLRNETLGGFSIHAGKNTFNADYGSRAKAELENAIEKLEQHKLIKREGDSGNIFSMAKAGFDLVDYLLLSDKRHTELLHAMASTGKMTRNGNELMTNNQRFSSDYEPSLVFLQQQGLVIEASAHVFELTDKGSDRAAALQQGGV